MLFGEGLLKIIQISKRLNKWEAGRTRGHERLIDSPVNLKDLLFNNQEKVLFVDKRDGNEDFKLTYAGRNWIRIPKKYYNKYNIQGGDEIILERRSGDDGKEECFIDFFKNENIIFQEKSFYDEENDETIRVFECLNRDLNSLNEKYGNNISIIYMGNFLRNKPSENSEKYYYECFDIRINGKSLLEKYDVNDMVEIRFFNNRWNVNFINSAVVCEMEV